MHHNFPVEGPGSEAMQEQVLIEELGFYLQPHHHHHPLQQQYTMNQEFNNKSYKWGQLNTKILNITTK